MTKGIQTKRIQTRDWETLSTYLDGQLSPNERSRLEKRLQASSDLRLMLEELRRTRSVLRSQPRMRAPRNFTLTPEMIGTRKTNRGFPSLFPALGLASALASALFVVVLLVDLLGGGPAGTPSIVAMQVTQEAALESSTSIEAPAAARSGESSEAAPQEPSIQQQVQDQTEVPAAAEEAAMALEAVLPTQSAEQMTEAARMTAAPPGMGEMPAPESEATQEPMSETGTGVEAEPYPLFTEVPANALAATPSIPDPADVFSDTLRDQQETIVQKSSAPTPYPVNGTQVAEAGSFDQSAPAETPQAGFWTSLRLLEAALALIAVAAGLAAFLLRRMRSA